MTDTDTRGGAEAARAAAKRLRAIGEGSASEEEPPELFRYADLAAAQIVSASQGRYSQEQQKQIADSLLEALTVLKFGSLLGGDPAAAAAARSKVMSMVELFEMALELGSE